MQIHPGPPLIVTTSWDDGHPADLRLADLLLKYGVRATFYVPTNNSEGRPVMHSRELASLAQHFEIGGHTRDHVALTDVPSDYALEQITSNKNDLEHRLGRTVSGFAYVRGRNNRELRSLVKQAGYQYARTIQSLSSTPARDPFDAPATIQFFNHSRLVYFRNFLSSGPTFPRTKILSSVLSASGVADRCTHAACACMQYGGSFHLWGHSWELDQYDLWSALEQSLAQLSELHPIFATNSEWIEKGNISPRSRATAPRGLQT